MKISKNRSEVNNLDVTLNGSKLVWVSNVRYLGIHVRSDLNDSDDILTKHRDFFVCVNSLMGNFQSLPSNILYTLFVHYCMSFYGSQAWNLRCKDKAFNRGLRTVWKLPYNTHTKLVLALSKCFPLAIQLARRFLKMFICMSGSDNVLVRFIAARCNNDLQCFLGSNLGLLHEEYDIVMTMNVHNVI